ncbi:MAG TPA: inositol monophosphatase, partial [Casimicrobiaceae bacterium]|nr:inositol monophosphatase [Casimicrobiaceae bacterium]
MGFTVAQARIIAAVLREAAQAEILPRFRRLGDGVREKASRLDLVTDADEAAEVRI